MKKFLLPLVFAAALLGGPLAHAAPVTFTAVLNGPSESPVNASPGAGFATVIFDSALHTMSLSVTFSGLLGTTTASHIHCCTAVANIGTAGVATQPPSFAGFPLGVTSGTYVSLFNLTLASSFNPAFVTANGGTVAGAETALLAGAVANKSYFNIHTSAFPAGEIRGFLVQSRSVPEPGSLALLALALIGLAVASQGKRTGTGSAAIRR